MRRIGSFVLLTLVVFLVGACASIVSKSDWAVKIGSSPPGADFSIVDTSSGRKIHSGKTPATVTLSSNGGYFKGKSYRVEISMEGYGEKSAEIKSTVNGWYVGNVLFGGLIGLLVVDPATGAMWTLAPKDVNLPLDKQLASSRDDHTSLSVVSMEDVPENLKDKLVKLQ